MKEILYALLALALMGCVDRNEINPDKETDLDKIANAEKLISTTNFIVPTQDGCITTVSYNGMVLARTSKSMTIKVPKNTTTSRSNDVLDVKYTQGTAPISFSNLWQTILFEDSKNGDYDYNDLIFHANYQIVGNLLKVYIQPIALGSTKDIKLRFKWAQNNTEGVVKVAESCREELFGNQSGFINTKSYDEYFPITKEFSIELPSDVDPVDISWFINLSDMEIVYAVNQNGDRCIDNDGMPYGFVLTDVKKFNVAQINKLGTTIKAFDEEAWNNAKPNVSTWANMPNQPSIPDNCKSLKANADNFDEDVNYLLAQNETFTGAIEVQRNTNYFIQGDIIIKEFDGSENNCYLYIMPGAKLTLDLSDNDGEIPNINIVNYGNIIWKNKNITFDEASFYSAQLIDDNQLNFYLKDRSKFYLSADAIINNLDINYDSEDDAKAYFNSLEATEVKLERNALLYVNGSLTTNDFITKDSKGTTTYVDCKLTISNKATMGLKGNLYVKGCITSPLVSLSNQIKVYLASGAMMDVNELKLPNVSQNGIYTIGNDLSLVSIDKLYTNKNLDKFFNEQTAVIIGKAYKNNGTLIDISSLKIDEGVKVNDMNVVIQTTSCTPGFNSESIPADNGIVWFEYPNEGINIASCYDFEAWKNGTFDFNKLIDADVFDVNNRNPKRGDKYPIYYLKQ